MDAAIFGFVNDFAGKSAGLDAFFTEVSQNYIFKGIVPMAIFWMLWWRPALDIPLQRARLISVLVVGIVAVALGRGLALSLPFRPRPMYSDLVEAQMPIGSIPGTLETWSSFPSDHAVLFFAVATALCFVSRVWGGITLVHAALIICLPRIFMGYHWPSDLLAGAVMGTLSAILLMPVTTRVVQALGIRLDDRNHSFLLMPCIFFVTFQLATLFDTIRRMLSVLWSFV